MLAQLVDHATLLLGGCEPALDEGAVFELLGYIVVREERVSG